MFWRQHRPGRQLPCLRGKNGEDDAHAQGMQEWVLSGGLFVVERVEDWPSDIGKIVKAFQRLLSEYENRISNWGWGIADYLTENAVGVLIKIDS